MTRSERRLLRHLIAAVAVKLVVLVALWWVFVRDARVNPDAEATAAHMGASQIPIGAPQ